MTKNEAIKKYIEKFGGFPYFLFLGASDEEIISSVTEALESGLEIKVQNKDADY